jgi:uncharacterized protein (DUF2249 family)
VTPDELDVRELPKPERHPTIFEAYEAIHVGASLDLVNDHDPRHLREEFELEHPGSHGWEYLDRRPGAWRIRITKLSSTPLPRVLCDTTQLVAETEADDVGALWKLRMRTRDLDSNLVRLPPLGAVESHLGPDLDVLVHVVDGTGQLITELDVLELHPGSLAWLPRRSRRAFSAGPDGLQYLTVHQRRLGLPLTASS